MNTGENIRNAVLVLSKTYESVKKLMDHCKAMGEDQGYVAAADKFLRWKSDNNYRGWLLNSFILVFQKSTDPECPSGNEWREGPVYTAEIYLGGEEDPDALPMLCVSKFEYEDVNSWAKGCSPTEHWGFYQPVHKEYGASFQVREVDAGITAARPKTEKISETYWGLKQVTTRRFPLTEVTGDTLRDVVFGTFDELAERQD